MRARVHVTLKQGVLDPQGQAVARSLKKLGFEEVEDVRLGKTIELTLSGDPQKARGRIEQMCRQLLANTVIEDYRIEIG